MKKTKKQNWVYCIILFILVTGFIIFQPRLSSFLFPMKRAILWNSFYQEIIKSKKLPLRSFWIFREFYYPGYFVFQPYKLSSDEANTALSILGISTKKNAYFYPFLSYHSGKIISLEALVTSNNLSKLIRVKMNVFHPLLQNKSTLVFYPEKNKVLIIFIRSLDQMKQTNGFFNYNGRHKEIVEGKQWFSASIINLN
jgi:hypothetical protein